MVESRVDLQIGPLLEAYSSGRLQPADVLREVHGRARESHDRNIWITLLEWDAIAAQLADIEARRAAGEALPLYGVPFAIKDNIDLANVQTTAACPSFAMTPRQSAPVVAALLRAGAVALGKTNLDQFATGLVGTRSPYGPCASAFDARRVSGGSSSGSALAVALGLASFSLGTDTAGSGRVPAAFNNIVGLKPTRGLLSTRGVTPAGRSLDCVSVFAASVGDAERVLDIVAGFDRRDPFARAAPPGSAALPSAGFRFGVPGREQLEFCGDEASEAAFRGAVDRLRELGGRPTVIDFTPFAAAGALLYQGPWVAERGAAVGDFIARGGPGLDPTVAAIIGASQRWSAADGFAGQYRLRELARAVEAIFREIDVLVVPTVPTHYTLEDIERDPIGPNQRLGTYTNFANLLDLCGLAVPAGFKAPEQPFGVTLLAPAFADRALLELGARLHLSHAPRVGATEHRVVDAGGVSSRHPPPAAPWTPAPVFQSIRLAVLGAHLEGQPLHHQLVELGARFEGAAVTAPRYRLFALEGGPLPKPGLVREREGGAAIAVEVYGLDAAAFGQFVTRVAQPLCIGNVELSSGEWIKGFLCEGAATAAATDITRFGGWRAYLASRS